MSNEKNAKATERALRILEGPLTKAIEAEGLDAATGALATLLGEILQRMNETVPGEVTGVMSGLHKKILSGRGSVIKPGA